MLAQAFAGYAGIAMANAALYDSADDEAWPMRTRAVVERARGFLMTSRPCSADEAFTLLPRAARRQDRGLGDVAADVLAEGAAAASRSSSRT